jgi:hypothetical protein
VVKEGETLDSLPSCCTGEVVDAVFSTVAAIAAAATTTAIVTAYSIARCYIIKEVHLEFAVKVTAAAAT